MTPLQTWETVTVPLLVEHWPGFSINKPLANLRYDNGKEYEQFNPESLDSLARVAELVGGTVYAVPTFAAEFLRGWTGYACVTFDGGKTWACCAEVGTGKGRYAVMQDAIVAAICALVAALVERKGE